MLSQSNDVNTNQKKSGKHLKSKAQGEVLQFQLLNYHGTSIYCYQEFVNAERKIFFKVYS